MTSASTAAHGSLSLRALLDDGARGDEIARVLDALTPTERMEQALSLQSGDVGRLYTAAAGRPALTATDFVPADTPDEATIIFEGKNSLPAFTRFQKRFARMTGGEVVGYNHGATSFATGPGYFTVRDAHPGSDVPEELYFDYTRVPERGPAGWPAVQPNGRGLSFLVYKDMKDYMRSVARNVVVGHAFKNGKSQGAYFVLCRP